MRKTISLVLLAICLLTTPVHASSKVITPGNGVVVVSFQSSAKVKVEVFKDGTSYYYDLTGSVTCPLQMGNGVYRISVLENIAGNRYKVVNRESIRVENASDIAPFLASVQNIQWNTEDKAVSKAAEFASEYEGTELVKAIYDYVVANVKYDYAKILTLAPGYLPNIDDTFQTGTGICYDYSALFAAMLRSQDIPVKLVMGYTPNAQGYHAWNEVLVDGKWIIVDTTYDSQMLQLGHSFSLIKDSNAYQASKVY